MADERIRINDLPPDASPNVNDVIAVDGASTRKATIAAISNAGRPFATEAEAIAGTGTTQTMNPLTTAQAINAIGGATFATTAQGNLADTALQPANVGDLAAKNNVNNADWSGADLAIENGGTGASSVSAARAALGAASTSQALPAGGTTGQILTKTSAADYSADWETPEKFSITALPDLP